MRSLRRRSVICLTLISLLLLLPAHSQGTEVVEEIMKLKARIELLEKKLAEKETREASPEEGALEERVEYLERETERLGYRKYPVGFFEALSGIETGGDLTLILQRTGNNTGRKDREDLSTSADLNLGLPAGPYGKLFFRANVGQGEGVAKFLPSTFSGPNSDLEFDDPRFQWVEAWLGATYPWPSIYDQRITFNIGKMDPTAFFDTNRLANTETDQFMADLFVNNLGIGWGGDDNGYGFGGRVAYRFTSIYQKGLTIEGSLGYFDSDGDFSGTFRKPFLITELDINRRYYGLDGNYRFYLWQNNRDHIEWRNPEGGGKQNQGFGFSMDQDLSNNLALFARYGYQDPEVSQFDQVITLGGRIIGNPWRRAKDYLGFAYGLSLVSKDYQKHSPKIDGYRADKHEHYFEVYYKYNLFGNLSLTPDLQYVINPGGDDDKDGLWVFGLRLQVNF